MIEKESEKILIINGTDEINGLGDSILSRFVEIYSQAEIEEIKLREIDIKPCTGCFNCWVRTPGLCMIDEQANEIAKKLMNSNTVVFVSKIVFGTYSYTMKKALDRMIQIILPYFTLINGEIHHVSRYDSYPNIIIIGISDEAVEKTRLEDEEQFIALAHRNVINMHFSDCQVATFSSNDNPEIMDEVFGKENKGARV